MTVAVEVVITGIGVVSPIGIGPAAFWQSLQEQRSGVVPLRNLAAANLPSPFGGEILEFDGKQYITPRKSLKVMCREIQFGVSAGTLAVADAKLTSGQIPPDRMGVIFGAELHSGELDELIDICRNSVVDGDFSFNRWGDRMTSDLYPLWMLKYLPNMTACHIGISQDARGPNNTMVLGDASSLLAAIEAFEVVRRGHADVMICGGTGSNLNITNMLYHGLQDISRRQDAPAEASRPFDASRDGMVNGEGSAALVLESRRSAEARGARIYAQVAGYGTSCEASSFNRPPKGTAILNSVRMALRSSQLSPQDIGHVNAHGLSTPQHDRIEARAIRESLGDVPVTAPKSFFGNLGAGSGTVEMVASVLGLHYGEIPVTLNYAQPDPECPIDVVHGKTRPTQGKAALVLSQSHPQGQAAAIVLKPV